MLFTPGPTEIEPEILSLASNPLPYFRDETYTAIVSELTQNLQILFQTKQRPLFLTSSGSGVMEMAIQNLTEEGDEVVVLNCGSFGNKWTVMCAGYGLKVTEVRVDYGKLPDLDLINSNLKPNTKALFVTAHETSTGLLNDIKCIAQLTKDKDTLLIVDGISSIGADEFKMDEWYCDCAMVSSNKALACIPGASSIVFSDKAWEVIHTNHRHKYYFDAVEYDLNAQRGMLPYTPAMPVSFMMHKRLRQITDMSVDKYILKHQEKAAIYHREINKDGMFPIFPERSSNAMTAVKLPENCQAIEIIKRVKEKYQWYIAPNPTQVQSYLRVSHMGNLTEENTILLAQRVRETVLELQRTL